MATKDNGEWQGRFPGFEFPRDPKAYAPTWTRVYPPDCDVRDGSDHLAVASGAHARWEAWGEWAFERGTLVGGRWVADRAGDRWREDLSGVHFDDVDVAYLDYLLKDRGYVAKRVAGYANGAGRARWTDRVWGGREAGWMYRTLGTFLVWQDRREDWVDWLEDTPDDGWAAGRTWEPGDETARPIVGWTRTVVPAAEERPVVRRVEGHTRVTLRLAAWLGPVEAVVTARETRGERVGSRWVDVSEVVVAPVYGAQVTRRPDPAVYRGPWASLCDAFDRLEALKAAVLERGPGAAPADAVEGPYAWLCEEVRRVVQGLPATGGDEAKERVFRALRHRADEILEWAEFLRLDDAGVDAPLDLDRVWDLLDGMDARPRSLGVKVTRRKDVALCEGVW